MTRIRLALTYLMLVRVPESFAEYEWYAHTVSRLIVGHVAIYADERQVEGGSNPAVDTVRFRGFNGDQGRKGAFWSGLKVTGVRGRSSKFITGVVPDP